MSTSVVYDSTDWESTYDFKISIKDNPTLFGLARPRNEGLHWIDGSDEPIIEGIDYGLKDIVITGVISKETNSALETEIVTFENAMYLKKSTAEFKVLYLSHNSGIKVDAIVHEVLPPVYFGGNPSTATKARITVRFGATKDYTLS